MEQNLEQEIIAFSQTWEQYLDDETHPHYELACVISNWLTWLWDKPRELANLEPELAEVKFSAWRELMDFHIWGSLGSLEGALNVFLPEQTQNYLDWFGDCQAVARNKLTDLGYQRICPVRGALLVPGEAIEATFQTTDQQELDGRVHHVPPGKAGYRKDGKILAPAEAVVYRYQPEETSSS